jgi:hypothetical protein
VLYLAVLPINPSLIQYQEGYLEDFYQLNNWALVAAFSAVNFRHDQLFICDNSIGSVSLSLDFSRSPNRVACLSELISAVVTGMADCYDDSVVL